MHSFLGCSGALRPLNGLKGIDMKKHKKVLLIAVILSFSLAFILGSTYSKNAYVSLRTVIATETTQLTATTQKTAPVYTDDCTVYITPPVGAVHIRFLGTVAADDTLSWTLWAYKSISDPAKFVAYGTATTGATTTGETNEFYCDTIVITDQQWFKTVSIAAGAPDAIVSGGGISELIFDSCEHTYFKVIIRDIAGGGAEAATAGAEIASFN